MPVYITCECDSKLKVPERLRGKKVRCPECDETITVPDEESASPSEAESDRAGASTGDPSQRPGNDRTDTGDDESRVEELHLGDLEEGVSVSTIQQQAEEARSGDEETDDERRDPSKLTSCPNCGKTLSRGDIVCLSCGTDLRTGKPVELRKQSKLYYYAKYAGKRVLTIAILGLIAYVGYRFVNKKLLSKSPAEKATQQIDAIFSSTPDKLPPPRTYLGAIDLAGKDGYDRIVKSIAGDSLTDGARVRGLQLLTLYVALKDLYRNQNTLATLVSTTHARRFDVADELVNLHVYRTTGVLPFSFQHLVPDLKRIREDFSQPTPEQISGSGNIRDEVRNLMEKSSLLSRLAGCMLFEKRVGHTKYIRRTIKQLNLVPEPEAKHGDWYLKAWYRITGIRFDDVAALRNWYEQNHDKKRVAWLMQALNRAKAGDPGDEENEMDPSRTGQLAYIHHQLRIATRQNIGSWSTAEEFNPSWIEKWNRWWREQQK